MIDPTPLLKMTPIFLVALMSPGPDFMLVSSTSLSRGRWAGVLAALGIACGNTVYAMLSILGLGVMLAHIHWLSILVRLAGGLYLLYLAILLWRGSFKPIASTAVSESSGRLPRQKNAFLMGLMTNMTNPKAMAFFTSIFAFALPDNAGHATAFALVAMVTITCFVWFSLVAIGLSAPAMRRTYLRCSHWIDRLAGTCLGFFGMRLILSVRD